MKEKLHRCLYCLFLGGKFSCNDNVVAQLVKCPLCDWKVVGSVPGRAIAKTSKMLLAACLLDALH